MVLTTFFDSLQEEPMFPNWIHVHLGGYTNSEAYLRMLTFKSFSLGESASTLIRSMPLRGHEQDLGLCVRSVQELGFDRGGMHSDIYEAAFREGLTVCPTEAGIELAIQHTEAASRERLLIGMDSLPDEYGHRAIFRITRDGEDIWLRGFSAPPHRWWFPEDKFVFLARTIG